MKNVHIYILTILGIFFFVLVGMNSDYLKSPIGWQILIPSSLLFGVVPFLTYLISKEFNLVTSRVKVVVISAFLFGGLIFNLVIRKSANYSADKRVETIAIVVKRNRIRTSEGNKRYEIQCKYRVWDEWMLSDVDIDRNNEFRVGDTLTVIYVEDHPTDHQIKELQY